MRRFAWLAVFVVACGGGDSSETPDGPGPSDGPESDGPDPDGPAGVFAITSPLYADGGAIPVEITCDGDDTSPQLDWVDPPAGALSFAIVFTDKTNDLRHSSIYDIPTNLTGLPADVDKVFQPPDVPGARQSRSFSGSLGYRGPCPGTPHMYEFAIYALDVATLPSLNMNSSAEQVETQALMHDLAVAKLTATYTPE